MQHDVFISYTTQDKPTADAICHALEANGVRCWIAPRDIPLGQNYAETLIKAIHSARLMVLVFSGSTNNSRHVRNEVERAFDKDVPVIPFRIEDTQATGALEYFLSLPHWLDAFTPPLQQHLVSLVDSVKALLMAQGGEIATPPLVTPAPVAPSEPPAITLAAAPAPPPATGGSWRLALIGGVATVALLAVVGALVVPGLLMKPHEAPVAAGRPVATPSTPSPAAQAPSPAVPPAPSPAVVAAATQPVSATWPEPALQFMPPNPDRNAALALLGDAAGELNDGATVEQFRLNIAEAHDMLASAYLDLGDRAAAIAQAGKAVTLADVPNGDWERNGARISNLSNAAIVLWRAGEQDRARQVTATALNIWQQSLNLPDAPTTQWIYGSPLVVALGTIGESGQAGEVYRRLIKTATSNALWSDMIGRAVLAFFPTRPVAGLVHAGQADLALTLATSLDDSSAKFYALTVLIGQASRVNRCDIAAKAAEQFVAAGGTGRQEFAGSFIADAANCQLKDLVLSAIDRVVATADDPTSYIEYPRLATAAAKVGAVDKANELLNEAKKNLSGREDDAADGDKCRSAQFVGGGPVSGRVPLIATYAALQDHARATEVADDLLRRADGMKDGRTRLRCTSLVAEALFSAKLWREADAAALKGFSILQAVGDAPADTRDPRKAHEMEAEPAESRIAIALGQNGHFAEASQALMRTSGGLTDRDRRELAVMATTRGNREAANMFLDGINRQRIDAIETRAQMARILAGLPAED